MNTLSDSDWANDENNPEHEKRQRIMETLWGLYAEGKISIGEIAGTADSNYGYGKITISSKHRGDPNAIAALLAHEGTHACTWYGGSVLWDDLGQEMAAFRNQYTVEAELGVLFSGSFGALNISDEKLENNVLRNYVLKEGFDPVDKNSYL